MAHSIVELKNQSNSIAITPSGFRVPMDNGNMTRATHQADAKSTRPGRHTTLIALFLLLSAILLCVNLSSPSLQRRLSAVDTASEHPSLIPLKSSDLLTFSLAFLFLLLSASSGVGGGGILVPLYILILGFPPKHAIPLGNVTVLGGSIANTLANAPRRHPHADKPLVDWNLIMAMEPPTLLGALVGANLNKVLPDIVLTVLLVVLLSATAFVTLRKAVQIHREEKWEKGLEEPLLAGLGEDEERESEYEEFNFRNSDHGTGALSPVYLQDGSHDHDSNNNTDEESYSLPESDNPLLQRILNEERHVNKSNVILLITLFLVILTINILKGGGATPSPIGIHCGSPAFWAAQLFLFLWIALITMVARRRLWRDAEKKMEAGYVTAKGDWDERSTLIFPLMSMVAGFCAGMFGIGGGIIKGPLMLAMGVHPAVASATSACMILFTSFTATTTFLIYGMLVRDYAVACLLLGLVATAVGQWGLSRIGSRRNSTIAFSIGGVVLLSAVLMTLESLVQTDGGDVDFAGICTEHVNGPA